MRAVLLGLDPADRLLEEGVRRRHVAELAEDIRRRLEQPEPDLAELRFRAGFLCRLVGRDA